jgi:phosphoserine phosphatase RsbU/P
MSIHDSSHRLACFELWGGNRRVARALEMPGLLGWVHASPFGDEGSGGDVHYFSVCKNGMISRITLADVAGHGQSASTIAERLRETLRKHTDSWDQSALVREVSEVFHQDSQGIQFATAAVLGFYYETGQLLFTYAGHPPALWYRSAEASWNVLSPASPADTEVRDLPLGLIPGTPYSQNAIQLASNDILILYTDGITEAKGDTGRMLGQEGLLHLVRGLPLSSPREFGLSLISGVEAFRGSAPRRDDETVIVIRRQALAKGSSPHHAPV